MQNIVCMLRVIFPMASLLEIYTLLRNHFGPLTGPDTAAPWWPIYGAEPAFEMLVGAVLVQQTRWETVEGAILRLIGADLLSPPAMAGVAPDELATLIRPAAFHTQKAPGLITIARHISEQHAGSVQQMLARPMDDLRPALLALPRIGRETCDVIMLYAGGHPLFVIDEYTRRLFERIQPGMQHAQCTMQNPTLWRASYEQLRLAIEAELTNLPSAPFYAEYHAQINEVCVRYCLSRPRCDGPPARRVYSRQEGRESYLDLQAGCPLRAVCRYYQATRGQG